MTGLLQKLVLGGYAKMQVINFSLQEMILPQQQGTTKIIYEWNQYFRDGGAVQIDDYVSVVQLLCTIQDRSRNVHFIAQGKYNPNIAYNAGDIFSNKDTHDLVFVSDQDICLTFGAFRDLIMDDTPLNPGAIPYTFNRPIGLNDQAAISRTLRRTALVGFPEYDYIPGNQYQDEMGYASSLNPLPTKPGQNTAVVKYLDVNLSMQDLQKLICTMI